MDTLFCKHSILAALLAVGALEARAWDYEGHHVINQLAVASLPGDFPAFAKTPEAAERIAFLAGEPDRWRNSPDLPLNHINKPDHYIDLEELQTYGLEPEKLPIFRYDFEEQLALIRYKEPSKFKTPDAAFDKDHTRQMVGLLPWSITEGYDKLKSCFSYLKAFEENGGTRSEIVNAQQNIIYVMGVMGHFAGDASQPLHTTIYFNGWTGPNPHQYTTNHTFHGWIDGGFFARIGGADTNALQARLRPAQLLKYEDRTMQPEEMFRCAMKFIMDQNKLVEPLYQLEKDGKLTGEGEQGVEGRAFLENQLLKSAQFLGDIWYSAWQQAPPDFYLARQLSRRGEQGHGGGEKK